MIFIYEFGRKHGLTMKQAFNYLYRYQGMAFLDKHYDYVHTQSFKSMVEDITEYCHRKGYNRSYAVASSFRKRNHQRTRNPLRTAEKIRGSHPRGSGILFAARA